MFSTWEPHGYETRRGMGEGVGPMKRRTFRCNWLIVSENGHESRCGVEFESTSPNAEVCPHHRRDRNLARSRRNQAQAVARRKAVGR